LRSERVAAVLGHAIPAQIVEQSLAVLGMTPQSSGEGTWQVQAPSYRFDLTIEEDLIEEVARLVGYDNIPAQSEKSVTRLGTATETRVDEDRIADILVARGYAEIISYSFTNARIAELINPGAPLERLANPISQDLSVMRRSLWSGLLMAGAENLSRQQERLRLFEIGPQFEAEPAGTVETRVVAGLACGERWPEHWDLARDDVDFFDLKADIEALVGVGGHASELRFSAAEHPALRPGRTARVYRGETEIGWLGELHPMVQQQLDFKKTPVVFALTLEHLQSARVPAYESYSKFPSLQRDLAVVVPDSVTAQEILNCVRGAAQAYLQNVNIFDVYRGGGIDSSRKSIGLGLILQDSYRTLTDKDADRTVAAVVKRLASELGATIRN
jgi:phenylalanyl-tRNA synthetase beta chain